MMRGVDIVAEKLASAGFERGRTLFVGYLPADADAVMLYEGGGAGHTPSGMRERVVIVSRGQTYEAAREMADTAIEALMSAVNEQVGERRLLFVDEVEAPLHVSDTYDRRPEFRAVVEVIYE